MLEESLNMLKRPGCQGRSFENSKGKQKALSEVENEKWKPQARDVAQLIEGLRSMLRALGSVSSVV